ncbi:hypothetical protein AJ79_06685 [Helicocarpus griseus UAMH5409]|uniref:RlpA-like protein double-psi beta-barrel domain-containing protein n=1 Tax=Helicocarpus griseus UAMH5409 TaxID=1447875 RepID=A0A2B7XAP0_9EURO|nr:hypothetical protein AJ79_06685 [Helicocarpus griseus UAMH5409]
MPPSITPLSPVSSLSRSVSSSSLKSLELEPHPHPSTPRKPLPAIVKDAGARVSISKVPRRKPVPPPKNTGITTAPTPLAISTTYDDAGSTEKGHVSVFHKGFKKPAFIARISLAAIKAKLPPLSTIKQKLPYKTDKRKQRIFLIAVAAAFLLLVLIIGLAAGLTSRNKKQQNLPLPTAHGGPYSGDLTYYDPALGACGITSSASENVCAVSHFVYDAVSTGSDPNQNPLCGMKLRLRRGERSVDVTVVDRCVGCAPTDIDVSLSVFTQLAAMELGRVDVQWAWLEEAPERVPLA